MLNIFGQPWTLLTAAAFALLVVWTIRQTAPDKTPRWLPLIPLFLAVAAFALDLLVRTDLEKVNALISTGLEAVENENCRAVAPLISPDYGDSLHRSKQQLLEHCAKVLGRVKISSNVKLNQRIEFAPRSQLAELNSQPRATLHLKVLTRFDPASRGPAAMLGKSMLTSELQIELKRTPEGNWLIIGAELLSIDGQPVRWTQI